MNHWSRPFWGDERGLSTMHAGLFLLLVALPVFALVTDLARYDKAAGEIQKAADMAALAAAQEVDIPLFQETGQVVLLPSAYGMASQYAVRNAEYLGGEGIHARVTGIHVAQRTVLVTVAANVDIRIAGVVPIRTIAKTGEAEVKLW